MARAKLYIDGLPSEVPIYETGNKNWFVMRHQDFMPLDQDIGSIKECNVKLCVVAKGVCWLVHTIQQSDPTILRFICERDDDSPEAQHVLLTEMILN